MFPFAAALLLLSSAAAAATSGASARTVRYEAGAADGSGIVRLVWEGEVENNGVDEITAQVVLRLTDAEGEEVHACRGEPRPLERLERSAERVSCPVPPELWARVQALQVGADSMVLAAEPEAEAPPGDPTTPGPSTEAERQRPDPRLARAERELAASEARLADAQAEVAKLTAEYEDRAEKYQDACDGSRGKPPRDPGRCEKLRAPMDKIQKELERLREKVDELQNDVEKDRGRVQDARARAGE